MRILVYSALMALVCTVAFLVVDCGKGRDRVVPAFHQAKDLSLAGAVSGQVDPRFTEEDYRVMAMPLSERIAYLEKKLKDLLFKHYGIVIEEDVTAAKKASLDDPFHKVCVYVDVDNPKENLQLVQTENKWEWTLSFLERLCGDYDWNGTVSIADITPIAMYFNKKEEDLDWMDGPYHVDRLANDDGKISIADITPLAINFGYQLTGYNVYWQDSTGGDWRLIAEWDEFERSSGTYRDEWSDVFTKKSIYRETSPPITIETSSGNDLIRVKPVFSSGEQDIPSETDIFGHELDSEDYPDGNHAPVAEITADPTEAECDETVTFDASGSTDEDEDTLYYEWDWDVSNGAQWFDSGTTDTAEWQYTLPRIYTATVCVTDQVGDWHTDTVEVEVEYVPATEPPTVIEFTVVPERATLPATIKFMTRAQDRDGDIIETIAFDPDGDIDWDDTFDDEDEEFTVENPGAPDYEKVYKAEYDVTFNRSDDCIADDIHTTLIMCRTKVADDDENDDDTINITPLSLTHASPVIHSVSISPKVGTSDPGNPNDPVTVTIDASDASDADGPDQFPTRFVFSFGDGSVDHTESYGQQGFDGIATHPYNDPGVYQITVTCYDDDHTDMEGSCNEPSKHVFEYSWEDDEDEDGKVWIYFAPVWKRNEVVDNGSHIIDGADWHSLGIPSIAIDINPNTGFPGVAYVGQPDEEDREEDWPLMCALFSEKGSEENGWSDPDMVWMESLEEEIANIGQQCDLTYQPSTALPLVAATIERYEFGTGLPLPGGIVLYYGDGGSWQYSWLVDDNTALHSSPIRLVSIVTGNGGNFVHYKFVEGFEEDPALMEICDTSDLNQYVIVESVGWETGGDVGRSHDQKPYQGNPYQRKNSTVYSYSLESTDYLKYELLYYNYFYQQYDWTGVPETISPPAPSTYSTRMIAHDYLGAKYGVLWVDGSSGLNFKQSDWQNEDEVEPDVGSYCDFDYDQTTGIICVAYEKLSGQNMEIYVEVYMDDDWVELEDPIDNLGVGGISHLDLDVSNGYIYVAYSKNDNIYCAVIDFYDR